MNRSQSVYLVAALALLLASPMLAQENLPGQAAAQPGTVFSDELTDGGRGPEMVVLPAGSYQMGCVLGLDCFDDQKPVHQVTISEAFAVSKFEITFEDYERFADSSDLDDEGWGRGRRPAINVSWNDAKRYVAWLSSQTGQTYRLLTEAEWEYAARAGSGTRYHFGNNQSEFCDYANLWDKDAGNGDAPCSDGAGLQTADAGSYAPNAFGLHDMHGNVYEWVEDCWNASYSGGPSDGSAWLDGDCSVRVLRSTSWMDYPRDAHAAIRVRFVQGLRNGVTGFRIARTLTHSPASVSVIDRWSPELQEAEPFESPFVTIFHYGEKKLCFVASKHDPRRDSPTSRTIAAVVKECEPDILMLEGLPNIISQNDREYFVREAENCEQNPDSYECGELHWAIAEVRDAKTAILGAEPVIAEEMEFIVEQSDGTLGLEDFFGYEISRLIIQSKRQEDFRIDDVPDMVADHLEYLHSVLPDTEQYDEASYRRWLEDEVGLTYSQLENDSYAPGNEEGSNLLQIMSYHSMLTRDHFAFERIQELLTEADSIFVMYGSSHLATLRRALTEGSTRVVNKKYE